MTRSVTIEGVEVEGVRLDFDLGSTAFRGEVGTGHLYIDDPDQTNPIGAYKKVVVTDDECSVPLVYTGFTAEREITRGDSMTSDGERQWDVTLEDINVMLGDRLIGGTGNRPEESDYARVQWLLGEGSLGAIEAGQVPNSNTKTMEGQDYRGRPAVEVLEDGSQRTGKNFYVYDEGSGYRLFYDKQGNAATSTIRVSDVPSDWDADTFAPVRNETMVDPARQYHEVLLKYKGGSIRGRQASIPSPRRKEKVVENKRIKSRSKAQDHLDNLLEQVADESVDTEVSVVLPASKVGLIRAGQKMPIRLAYAGLPWTNYRVKAVHVGPKGSDKKDYIVRLEMADKIRPTHVAYPLDMPSINTGGDEKGGGGVAVIETTTITGGTVWTPYDHFERGIAYLDEFDTDAANPTDFPLQASERWPENVWEWSASASAPAAVTGGAFYVPADEYGGAALRLQGPTYDDDGVATNAYPVGPWVEPHTVRLRINASDWHTKVDWNLGRSIKWAWEGSGVDGPFTEGAGWLILASNATTHHPTGTGDAGIAVSAGANSAVGGIPADQFIALPGLVDGADYYFDVSFLNGIVRARVFLATDPEPDWQVDCTMGARPVDDTKRGNMYPSMEMGAGTVDPLVSNARILDILLVESEWMG